MSNEKTCRTFIAPVRTFYRFLRALAFAFTVVPRKQHRRHAKKWLSSMIPGYLLRKPCPWFTFSSIEFLEANLPTDGRVFEYGSGGSTLFWISKGAKCVSVEHDASWHGKLKYRLSSCSAVDYRLVLPQAATGGSLSGSFDDPTSYLSSDKRYKDCSFYSYASQIDDFPPDYFDVVLVDGRARPSCIRHAIPRIKPGGMLILDNSDRPNYFRAMGELSEYRRVSFRGIVPHQVGCGQTDFFIKPV